MDPALELKIFSTNTSLGLSIDKANLPAFEFSRLLWRALQLVGHEDWRLAITAARYYSSSNQLHWQMRVVRADLKEHIALFGRGGKDEKSLPNPDNEMRVRIGAKHLEGIKLPEVKFDPREPVPVKRVGHDGDYYAVLPPQFKEGF
jgi:hypothetical protein